MVQKKHPLKETQLSLFEESPPEKPSEPTTVLDFVRARFEHGPEMTQEEYKRWIKILIHNSLKSID